MHWLQAIFLGLVQGVTEFFPISSSAHLKFFKTIFDLPEMVLFDLFCHLGTLLALVVYFRRDIFLLFQNPRLLFPFIIALCPLIPFYFLLKPLRETLSKPEFLGFCLIGTAGFLYLASVCRRTSKTALDWKDALWVGTLQGVALIPGLSRSAATITAGVYRGATPHEAVRFSFILSVPAVAGGIFLESLKIPHLEGFSLTPCLLGFAVAAIVGLVTVRIAIPLLQKGVLRPFAWYCLIGGILLSIFL